MSNTDEFQGWAVLELMGHRRLAGYLTPTTLAGKGMIRLDVPGADGKTVASPLYSPEAIYAVTPVSEEIARAIARSADPKPYAAYELQQLASGELEPEDMAHAYD